MGWDTSQASLVVLPVVVASMFAMAAAFQLPSPVKNMGDCTVFRSPSSAWRKHPLQPTSLPHPSWSRQLSLLHAGWPFGGGKGQEKEEANVASKSEDEEGTRAVGVEQDGLPGSPTPTDAFDLVQTNGATAATTAEGTVAAAGAGDGVRAEGAATTPSARKKPMAAARAAVAVMERIKEKDELEKGGGHGGEASLRPAKTTRDAMFNVCVKEARMTADEGMRAVRTFVYALGSGPLATQDEKADLVKSIEKRELLTNCNFTSSEAAAVTSDAWSGAPSTAWDDESPSIYDDELLRHFGSRAPLVANEIDAVLLSKPGSSEFSRVVLSSFKTWATSGPVMKEWRQWIERRSVVQTGIAAINAAFQEVDRIIFHGDLQGREVNNTIRQVQANNVGDLIFSSLGNPKGSLAMPDQDVEIFVEKVLSGFATVEETVATSSGLRLIRWKVLDRSLSAAEVSKAVRDKMASTGLNTKFAAFLKEDIFGGLDSFAKFTEELNLEATMANPEDLPAIARGAAKAAWTQFTTPRDDSMLVLVPAATRPQESVLLDEQGRSALALGTPITLCAFLGQAFDGSPVEAASRAVDGDIHLLAQVGLLGVVMGSLLLARDAARAAAAKLVGVELAEPLPLPSFETGVLARKISLASYPSNAQDLFDVALAGPVVGLSTAAVALVIGLQMTAAAGPDTLAGFPSLPSSFLQSSSLVGSMVDFFLHTSLAAKDLAAERIAMHPLAVGGAAAMLWNAAAVLPLQGSDGQAVIDTLDNKSIKVSADFATFLATIFVIFRSGGNFLLWVFAMSFVAYPGSTTIIQEDNVTPVRSPPRLFLAFLVAAVSLVVLTPMTVSTFLGGGP